MTEDKKPLVLDKFPRECVSDLKTFRQATGLGSDFERSMAAGRAALERSENARKQAVKDLDISGIQQVVDSWRSMGGNTAMQLNKELAETVSSIRKVFSENSVSLPKRELPSIPAPFISRGTFANPARELLEEQEETNELLAKQVKTTEEHLDHSRKASERLLAVADGTVQLVITVQAIIANLENEAQERRASERKNGRRYTVATILSVITLAVAVASLILQGQAQSGKVDVGTVSPVVEPILKKQLASQKFVADPKQRPQKKRRKKTKFLTTQDNDPLTAQGGDRIVLE